MLLEDIKNGKHNMLIFALFFIFLFHCYWKIKDINVENFAESSTVDNIKASIKETYNADIDSIRNLSAVAKTLQGPDKVTMNGDFTLQGKIKSPIVEYCSCRVTCEL